MKQLLFFSLAIVMTACSTYSENDKKNFNQEITSYLKKNNLECQKSESGIYYKIIKEGDGDFIQFDDVILTSYKGTLLDGTVFDEQKEPIELQFNDMIMGWKEVLLYAKKGTKLFVAVPPQLGYGDHQLDKIPQNSCLLFEISIVDVL